MAVLCEMSLDLTALCHQLTAKADMNFSKFYSAFEYDLSDQLSYSKMADEIFQNINVANPKEWDTDGTLI